MTCEFLNEFPNVKKFNNHFILDSYSSDKNDYSVFLNSRPGRIKKKMEDAFSLNLNYKGKYILGGVYDGHDSSSKDKEKVFWETLSSEFKEIVYKDIIENKTDLGPNTYVASIFSEIDEKNLSKLEKLKKSFSIALENIKNSYCVQNYDNAKKYIDNKIIEFANIFYNHSYETAISFEKIFTKHYQENEDIQNIFEKTYYELSKNIENETSSGGVCAANFFIKNNTIYHANVGDCQCAIISKNKVIPLTITDFPHKYGNKMEYDRLVNLGASLRIKHLECYMQLANGTLMSISRSLGDNELKEFGIISTPHTGEYKIQPDDKFLIAASDGFLSPKNFSERTEYLYPLFKNMKNAKSVQPALSEYIEEELNPKHFIDDKVLLVIPLNNNC